MFPLMLCFAGAGLLFIGISVPLIQRRIAPNPWYGYRVPQTLRDPALWYPVNAYAGRLLCGVGLVTILLAPMLAVLPGISPDAYGVIMSAVLVGGALLSFLLGWRHLQRLQRERS